MFCNYNMTSENIDQILNDDQFYLAKDPDGILNVILVQSLDNYLEDTSSQYSVTINVQVPSGDPNAVIPGQTITINSVVTVQTVKDQPYQFVLEGSTVLPGNYVDTGGCRLTNNTTGDIYCVYNDVGDGSIKRIPGTHKYKIASNAQPGTYSITYAVADQLNGNIYDLVSTFVTLV